MAKPENIAKCVTLLAEAFGRQTTPMTFEVYSLALADVDDARVQSAALRAAKTCRFMPTPSELRELAGIPTTADRALIAWGHVEQVIGLGPYKHLDFDDRSINAAIRSLGGWVTFLARLSSAEAYKWARLEFMKAYEAYHRSGDCDQAGAPLVGLSNAAVVDGHITGPLVHFVATGLAPQNTPRLKYANRKQLRIGHASPIGEVLSNGAKAPASA